MVADGLCLFSCGSDMLYIHVTTAAIHWPHRWWWHVWYETTVAGCSGYVDHGCTAHHSCWKVNWQRPARIFGAATLERWGIWQVSNGGFYILENFPLLGIFLKLLVFWITPLMFTSLYVQCPKVRLPYSCESFDLVPVAGRLLCLPYFSFDFILFLWHGMIWFLVLPWFMIIIRCFLYNCKYLHWRPI